MLCFSVSLLSAQTLARPGWAGSGLSAEPWWRNAVFYSISPATFQDSDGDGKGDLRGIAQRMGYLQTLAVDAVVLQTPFDETGFDDLLSEASRRHIRVVIALSPSATTAAEARSWLTRGCAGIWLRVPPKADAAQTAALLHSLRSVTNSLLGQRVLVEDTSADAALVPQAGAQLVTRTLQADARDAVSLRAQLAQLNNVPQGSFPVLSLTGGGLAADEAAHSLQKIFAAALLLSRSAMVLQAGQEIDRMTTGDVERVMQWTPSNVTRPPVEEPAPEPPRPPRREDDYTAFVPYVAPKKPAHVAGQPPDLNELPGFTSKADMRREASVVDSVAAEDSDVNSLLNFYRRLSQLHHEELTLRSGATVLLDRNANGVLAWVRKAAPGVAASLPVFVACNLSDSAKTISFAPEFMPEGQKAVGLHSLAIASSQNAQYLQRSSSVTVAPQTVVVLGPSR